jgi:hypothetical protein
MSKAWLLLCAIGSHATFTETPTDVAIGALQYMTFRELIELNKTRKLDYLQPIFAARRMYGSGIDDTWHTLSIKTQSASCIDNLRKHSGIFPEIEIFVSETSIRDSRCDYHQVGPHHKFNHLA